MQVISTEQWYKKYHFAISTETSDMYECLMSHPRRLISPLNVFIYRKEAAGFQPPL